ncbi:WASH complex subunit 2-like [Colletes gigas]|uniref:WASH complex subunit 2-like n=1 Tax=Colletes gigas TaxID=935657 RepID=UPI001C9B0BBD|nr:WASH complex subunit 2-like [Colletes gigas]
MDREDNKFQRSFNKTRKSNDTSVKNPRDKKRRKHPKKYSKNDRNSDALVQASRNKSTTSPWISFTADFSSTTSTMDDDEVKSSTQKSESEAGSLFKEYYEKHLKKLRTTPKIDTSTTWNVFSSSVSPDSSENEIVYEEKLEKNTENFSETSEGGYTDETIKWNSRENTIIDDWTEKSTTEFFEDDDNNSTTIVEENSTKPNSEEDKSDVSKIELFSKEDRTESTMSIEESTTELLEEESEKPCPWDETLVDNAIKEFKKNSVSKESIHHSNLSVQVENGLYESNSWNSKVDVNLLSKDRLSNERPKNSSMIAEQTLNTEVDRCKSKCALFWKKYTMKNNKKLSQSDFDEILKSVEKIDSGLIEETVVINSNEKRRETPWYSAKATRVTESTDLVEFITDPSTSKPKAGKKRPKDGKRRRKDRKKGKENRRRNQTYAQFTTPMQRETTISFEQTWLSPEFTYSTRPPIFEESTTYSSTTGNVKEFLSKETVDHEGNETEEWMSSSTLENTVSTDFSTTEDFFLIWGPKKRGKTTVMDPDATSEETSTKSYVEKSSTTDDAMCDESSFHCKIGTCIPQKMVCDGVLDCTDASDEFGCDYNYRLIVENETRKEKETRRQPVTCGKLEFLCDFGTCIGINRVCDSVKDCQDGSDEARCRTKGREKLGELVVGVHCRTFPLYRLASPFVGPSDSDRQSVAMNGDEIGDYVRFQRRWYLLYKVVASIRPDVVGRRRSMCQNFYLVTSICAVQRP